MPNESHFRHIVGGVLGSVGVEGVTWQIFVRLMAAGGGRRERETRGGYELGLCKEWKA